MKILIISSLFPPNIFGGAEMVAYNYAVSLVSANHDVHVITIKEPSEKQCWGEKSPEGYSLYKLEINRNHTLYSRANNESTKEKFIWHLQDHFDVNNKVGWKQLLEKIRPDHINIQNIMGFGFNVLPILADGKVSVSYVAHDFGLVCFKTTMFRHNQVCKTTCLQCKPTSYMRQYYFKKMQRIGVISPTLIHFKNLENTFGYLSKLPKLVFKNPMSDLPDLPSYKPSKITRFVYVGRIDEVKGLHFLLNVFDELADKYFFHLSIYGTGPHEKKLQTEYNSKKWVTFNGFVPSEDIPKHLVQSDYYCIPSLWPEVYGMTTALSLKVGTPVIGSNIGGTAELVMNGKTGLLIKANDKNSWKSVLIKVIENKSLSNKLRQNLKDDQSIYLNKKEIMTNFFKFIEEL